MNDKQRQSANTLFSRTRPAQREARARAIGDQGAGYLVTRAAEDMAERLTVTNREFEAPLLIFPAATGWMTALEAHPKLNALEQTAIDYANPLGDLGLSHETHDLILAPFVLHWMNDLPGALFQIARALKPDGLFLATLPGDGTLGGFREALLAAETETTGGAHMRIEPFADVRQAGALLQRAGLKLPVTDLDPVTVRYASLQNLVQDLRAMGATSKLFNRAKPITPTVWRRTCEIHAERFADEDGRLPVHFQIVHLSGWKEHESQQKPLKPGSAKVSLAKVLKPTEKE